MKSTALFLFLITGICSGLSAMYVWGGYMSGLPISWWSEPLICSLLAASMGMVLAGAAIFFSMRVGRLVALSSGGVLEAFFFTEILAGLGSLRFATRDAGLNWAPFAGLILLPFLLTTASLIVAWRVR